MIETHTLTKEEIRQIVSDGVQDAFVKMGIQVDDPLEMQRDFQHLREWRQSLEQVRQKSIMAAVGLVVAGALSVAWMGVRAVLSGQP
jgi:hypothetical protein